jgi:hypothetical protein
MICGNRDFMPGDAAPDNEGEVGYEDDDDAHDDMEDVSRSETGGARPR